MRPVLTIVDDFLDDPLKVRESVIGQGFEDLEHEGVIYKNVNPHYKPPEIHEKLEQLYGRPVQINLQVFRCDAFGSKLHNLVHSDNTCSSLAAVLYLNLPKDCEGGTAFWEHIPSGLDQQPTQEQLDEMGRTIEDFCEDRNKELKWKLLQVAPMRFNRLITYPTVKFHSRWPWHAFGQSYQDARLIHAIFFDVL